MPLLSLKGEERFMAEEPTYEDLKKRIKKLEKDASKQKGAEADLRYRIEVDDLITSISTHFINLSSDEIDQGIQTALERMGELVGSDRSYLFRFSPAGDTMSCLYEWVSEGTEPQIEQLKDVSPHSLPRFMAFMERLEVYNVPSVPDLPPEADTEKSHFQEQGIQSLVCVPVHLRGALFGFLGFDSVKQGRYWSEDLISLLKIVGELFVNALERKRMEEFLKESERRYREVLENIVEGYYEVDLSGSLTFFNNSLCEMSGASHDELMDLNYRDYTDPDTADRIYQTFSQVYHTGESVKGFEYEVFFEKKGASATVETSVSLKRDPQGRPTGFRGMIRDITDRKAMEAALRREKEKFRALVEDCPLGVSLIAEDGTYKHVNPKFVEMFGYALQDVPTGKEWFQKAFPDRAYRRDVISRWINDFKGSRHGESRPRTFKVRCKDGSEKMIHFRPVAMESGQQLVMYEDVTEKRRLEMQLYQAQKMEAIGTLSGGIAHDFNNLLMAIQGNASLMLTETHSESPHYGFLTNIVKQVQSGAKLTSQLLGFSRKGRYEIKAINLNQAVKDVCETFARTRKDIKIHQDLTPEILAIHADRGQIEQILLNLYVNAADAMPGGGDLHVTTMNTTHESMKADLYTPKPGLYLLLEIRDTGMGMDKETTKRIFDPFFTTKEMGRGTGLGLASVYGIVKGHGGYIDVHSIKGGGTTFSIYLPASRTLIPGEEPGTGEEVAGGRGTILLVDDEHMVLDVGAQMLEHLGYTVLQAASGSEAIRLYRKNMDTIDLVILDMIMPEMGGGKVYDRLKALNPDVRVLLSSGYSLEGEAKEILDRGCGGFIQKPFDIKDVSRKIRQILSRPS